MSMPTKDQVAAHDERGGRWLCVDGSRMTVNIMRVHTGSCLMMSAGVPCSLWLPPAESDHDVTWSPIDDAGNPLPLLAERDQLIASVAELKGKLAKFDERQAGLTAIANGVNEPTYEAEEIDDTLDDCGLTGYESAEYGWGFCQESYRNWIKGLTATLLPSRDGGVSE